MAKDKLEPEGAERWGIFGGLFNPIHHGHLIPVQVCLETLALDRFLFVPTKNPPHRKAPSVSFEHRFAMTEKAIASQDHFHVSRIEAERSTPSFSYDTIVELNERYPGVEFTFTVGMDELESFDEWHRWQEILDTVTVTALKRPGHAQDSVPDSVLEEVRIVDVPLIQISSTEIRKRIKRGKPVRYYVPTDVNSYIHNRDLYRE